MSRSEFDNTCYICGEYLPTNFVLGAPESWYCKNVAPDAASGGTMAPIHHRCERVTPNVIQSISDMLIRFSPIERMTK